MGRSRRKYKQSRTKVRVGLPKRKPNVFKPAFCLPPKLRPQPPNGTPRAPSSKTTSPSASSPTLTCSASGLAILTWSRAIPSRSPLRPPMILTPPQSSISPTAAISKRTRMFMDTKLNKMQHSVATLEKLCRRYHVHKDRNPLILTR